MGTPTSPTREVITNDSISLLKDGKPWLPVMGEIHYSRVRPEDWKTELLKMKAGGIDIIATYIFWIHHEEIEGEWDWTGCRDLRKFIQICDEVDLPIVIRCGPWCHGEVRNGGLPDWILNKPGVKARSLDPAFLEIVKKLYQEIQKQVDGLLWKQGGPVVGLQVDNEYGGPAEYLLALKKIAVDLGLDVPIYTRTGWPSTSTPMPFGELLPLYGAYAEGFWERVLEDMPGHYWGAFCFEIVRTDVQVGADMLGERAATDEIDTAQYPYLTCELGGGMEQSYHRRILIHPMDVLAVAIAKIGSGGNLPGYYMYHGGTNPEGKLSTLQESQATKYWNDSPVKSYDFQAPLGQYGQVREHYHLLRRLHLMCHDFGDRLARMRPVLPEEKPKDKQDTSTLRWSLRTDDKSGFLFVNNYQRLLPMPKREAVGFQIDLLSESITISDVTIEADTSFCWPINLDLDGAVLKYATAQLVCDLEEACDRYVVFGKVGTAEPQFVFDNKTTRVIRAAGKIRQKDPVTIITELQTGKNIAIELATASGKRVKILLLDEKDSQQLSKLRFGGKERLIIADSNLTCQQESLTVHREKGDSTRLLMFPKLNQIKMSDMKIAESTDGIFSSFELQGSNPSTPELEIKQIKAFSGLRKIPIGFAKVAVAPTEYDLEAASVWRICVKNAPDNAILRVHYFGDIACFYIKNELLTDNFFNGRPFDLHLGLFSKGDLESGIELRILPLQKDSPILYPPLFREKIAQSAPVVELQKIELISTESLQVTSCDN